MMGSIYRLESIMTARAMAAYGSQVTRKASTITTTIRATCTSTRFVLPASDTCSLLTCDTRIQAERLHCDAGTSRCHLFITERTNISIAHLAERPQELRVRHHDDRERHNKAKAKVHDDVGHVSSISAVPVRGAGGLDAFQLITAPTKQRRSVPHKRPNPGEHHSSNCMSEGRRSGVSHAVGPTMFCSYCL